MGASEAGRAPGAAAAARGGAAWQAVAERGSIWGLRFTVACYRLLGRRASLGLVYAVVTYFFLTDPAGRRASRAYLARVRRVARTRGGPAATLVPGLRASYRHYCAFALAIVDRLAIWFDRAGDFVFETHGVERFDDLAREGRGAVILGAHLGSFDALRLLAKRTGKTVHVLMFTANAPRINAVFREISPEAEARIIHAAPGSVAAAFEIRACLRRGEHVAILADRMEANDRGRGARVSLLGDPVELPEGPFLLACALGCPLFWMVALREGPARYRVHAEELAPARRVRPAERNGAAAELMAAYAERLEHYTLQAPLQWFNFFDYWGDARAAAGEEAQP